ncbi:MAG: sn-glycerol-3-phosphate ABC transporter ATP-binding protein UgpC [bacterium]|nr:sn-glycerol-3-phosphate ABC transporter ATP-binding protein UgpC [bacterium]
MSQVVISNVTKTYPNGATPVKEISLTIDDGEFLVLVGPSGCGKSTTLRMIAGLESISAGTISIGDRVVNDVPPKDRDIAMVFQNYALYPHLTVRENLAFGLKLRKIDVTEIEQRVNEAANILGLQEMLDRKPRELSGGQRQRVAVGRAIVRQPQVFLFDEPLSNLDAKLRVQMRAELAQLHRRLKTTIVYVTHDQVEAMTLGTRVAVLNDGKLQQVGAPLELYRKPANRFVAGFIGSPAMNFFSGSIANGKIETSFASFAAPITYHGKLTIGIRPEVISLYDDSLASTASQIVFPATITLVEPLGNESLLHATTGNESFVARGASSVPVTVGERRQFSFAVESAHYFSEPEGGRLA